MKCVTTGPYRETGEEQGACTRSSLVILNATGFGPTTFSPQKQYVHDTQQKWSDLSALSLDGRFVHISSASVLSRPKRTRSG